ncbi:MAG: hypothetical protein QOI20_2431, partial [Acidimicrobiaceae bacterium]|nr:hypothetical protein [Acidimicrobiaceae bacterium]
PATLTVGGIIVPGSMRAVVVLLPNTTSLNNFSAVWVSSFTIA